MACLFSFLEENELEIKLCEMELPGMDCSSQDLFE